MKTKALLLLFICVLCNYTLQAQEKAAYKIYNSKGKKVSYKQLLKSASKSDIVLFGELHNNPICHWLELEITKDVAATKKVTLGAEMIETDNQDVLNNYLADKITYKGLDTLARLWSNYKTDYAPLVEFAKTNNTSFIATNVPRRYASMVYKQGGFSALDELTDLEKKWIAPLPIPYDKDLSQYKKMLTMMGDHGTEDIVKAQAIKDATMAYNITKYYQFGETFIHYNGAFHSDFHQGIMWYLQQYNNNVMLNILTITSVEQEDINTLEKDHLQQADYIICIDKDMTKTY